MIYVQNDLPDIKLPQNLEHKLMNLYFSKAFFGWFIYWGIIFEGVYWVNNEFKIC